MTTETLPIGQLKPSEYNPRKATEEQHKHLTESIQRFGMVDPIIVNKHAGRENVVVGGHFRLRVAKDLGWTEVPVFFVDLDEEREKELNLRLNRNLGEWDWDKLANFDMDFLKGVGFDEKEPKLGLGMGDDSESLGYAITCPHCGGTIKTSNRVKRVEKLEVAVEIEKE